MNLNELAQKVSVIEGGKQNLSISQIKEVIAAIGKVLCKEEPNKAIMVFAKIIEKAQKK